MSHPLTRYRTRHDLSQSALAKKLGVAEATVSRWETRSRYPRGAELRRIVKLTGISVSELLGFKKEKPDAEKTESGSDDRTGSQDRP